MFSTPKFKIGDQVVAKQTGYPGVGNIIGCIPYIIHCQITKEGISKYWVDLYPECPKKPIYYVYFNDARQHMTLEEMLAQVAPDPQMISKNQHYWYATQHQLQPKYNIVYYPEDDLEKWE